jgi:type IV secretory pathway VirJ component
MVEGARDCRKDHQGGHNSTTIPPAYGRMPDPHYPLQIQDFAMRPAPLLFIALLLTGAAGTIHSAVPAPATSPPLITETEEFGDLGRVEILHAGKATDDLLLLLDDGGAHGLAQELARQGHWVAYLPLRHLLDNTTKHRDACIDATTLLDVFSQHVQEKYRFPHYQKPVVIGSGAAAAMAYTITAQAPQRLFATGIGIDFCPLMKLPAPPCRGNGALHWTSPAPGSYRLQPLAAPTTPWVSLGTGAACADLAQSGFPGASAVAPAELANRIKALVAPKPRPTSAQNIAVDDLGLVELAATPGKTPVADDLFVVLLSGDGGWADIDKDIGEQLSRAGLPVVGWNTLQYFWNRKTPEIASADLQRVLAHYAQAWKKQRVLLIGFSLGADVLPFMVSRLPAPERARIKDIALLSLSHTVDFEFHVSAWLGSSQGDTHQVAPELKKIGEPVLCVYGSSDDDTLCKEFRAPNVTTAVLPGDHHYEGDFEAVTKLILKHLEENGRRQR